jgi:ABC-2 type transport system permease protein
MRREFGRISARPVLWGLLIVAPILLFAILGGIYSGHVVTDIPIAVCDQDHSELSRMIVRMFESTRSLRIIFSANSSAEIEEGIKTGRIQGGFVIPGGTEDDMKTGRSAHVVVYKNTANLIVGNLIYRDAATIIKTVSGGVLLKKLRSKGMGEEQAMGVVAPIRLDVYSLFNPGFNYADFLVATLLPVLLQMILVLAGVLAVNVEYAESTARELFADAEGSPAAALAGKLLPYFLFGEAMMLGLLGLLFPCMGIAMHGSIAAILLFSGLYVLAVLLPSLLISIVVSDMQTATEIVVIVTTPAFLFSGETFPVRAMPRIYQAIAQMLPSTHYLSGFIKLEQYGAPFRFLWPEICAFSLFIILPGVFIWWRLRHMAASSVTGASTPKATF